MRRFQRKVGTTSTSSYPFGDDVEVVPTFIWLRRNHPVKTLRWRGAGIVHDGRGGSGSGKIGQVQPANLIEVRSVLNLVSCPGHGTEAQLSVGGAGAHDVGINYRWRRLDSRLEGQKNAGGV